MVAIGRSSHAFFFDGVSDSVIIPQGRFTKTGVKDSEGNKLMTKTLQGSGDIVSINNKSSADFIIEAWVVPDCGGVIAHREGQFTLEMGTVDTPGPAVFSVSVESIAGPSVFRLATAYDASTRWDGIVYPQQEHGGIHDSYNRYDTSNYGDATNLNFANRPLYHVVAGLNQEQIFLAVNGEIVAEQDIPAETRLARSTEHVYLGGKGGEFRGAIEAIHFSNEFDENMIQPSMAVKGQTTSALFRFEEPIDVVQGTYDFTAYTVTDASTKTLTMSTSDAQALIARLTGKAYDSSSPTTTFTAKPYSMGNYKVVDYYTNTGTPTTLAVPHTPYNLLINPGAINRNTQKPNQSPPERVRLESINGSTGVVTFSSIHIDFVNGTSGIRGALHSRTADVDNYFVVVGADLLIDNGTGKPYQPPHYGTQIFDKTGQMILDESNTGNHGLVYSNRMATTDTDTNNPFAVAWPADLDPLFQIGHSGRHAFSHITGHEYMRRFPKPSDLIIDQQADGSADIVQMAYDSNTRNIDEMFVMNSLIDFYSETLEAPIARIENSSSVATITHNGLPTSKRELIAIGGSGFKYAPFMLKGPVPQYGSIDENNRLYHLVPETESRVALLHVPDLKTSHNLAPYVEVHYNAVDLTGASMGESVPMLMVEKTVPAGSFDLGSKTVLQAIIDDLANCTLYSPGGVIYLSNAISGYGSLMQESHTLIGDNTGGQESDTELDYSRTPELYTPVSDVNAEPASPPKAIKRSHNTGTHESVYHRLVIEGVSPGQSDTIVDEGAGKRRREPTTDKTGTGVFDLGPTTHSSRVFEMFNIIDNVLITDEAGIMAKIFVQPSVKSRVNQLSLVRTLQDGDVPNIASIMFLMSRCRVRGVSKQESPESNMSSVVVTATGIADSFVNENVSVIGSGSPDSHVVKEIEPNAPVVTVTLGGPGQGGVNTKPTFDPSPLMRLPGSTRRNCVVQAKVVHTTVTLAPPPGLGTLPLSMSVTPLNNGSPDLVSWGTICFPKKGRIYLQDGASAEYDDKSGAGFYFSNDDAIPNRKFLDAAGTAYSTFHDWCNATGIINQSSTGTYLTSVYISNDGDFDSDSLTQDGSTVNDRLFQSLDTVTHDYQLGTQFASTRAMVEIPVFPQQFFDHTELGIFPGPDNSMKLHVDATYTAHTWNPTPVGRRADDIGVADKSANSAYSYSINNKSYIESATILRIEDDSTANKRMKIFVSHPKMFPDGSQTDDFGNLTNIKRLRRVFLTSNDWAVYNNDPITDGFLNIPIGTHSSVDYHDGFSADFFVQATVGAKIHIGGGFRNETLIPVASDTDLPSSDYEGRSPYYYDMANMMTQGGNLDYGLRQYVSAVEFKAGPLANPHAPRTQTKRASSKILQVNGSSGSFELILEDASLFPDVPFTRDSSNAVVYEQGDVLYIAEIMLSTPIEVLYEGRVNNTAGANSITIEIPSGVSYTVADFIDTEIRLKKVGHTLSGISDPANALDDEKSATTFFPSTSDEQWTFVGSHNENTETQFSINNGNKRLAHANTVGVNIRKGDKLYAQTGSSGSIKYIGEVSEVESDEVNGGSYTTVLITSNNVGAIANGDRVRIGANTVIAEDFDAILNRSWLYPYAQGGLRNGDTVWMNMTLNNPHAVEGLFAKSRGVFNEGAVWKGFNGGQGTLADRPRDSIPLENFLIGDSCLETAQNFAQHVNKTVEMNYEAMGLDASQAPTVAYIDPYLSTDGNARVLLFDVAHDREFIAFHDLHMQVQSSAATPTLGYTRNIPHSTGTIKLDKHLVSVNGGAPHYLTTQLDVANGFPSENKFLRSTQQSKFIESAYAHNTPNMGGLAYTLTDPGTRGANPFVRGKGHGHFVHTGYFHEQTSNTHTVGDSTLPRVQPAVASVYYSNIANQLTRVENAGNALLSSLKKHRADQDPNLYSLKDASTLFDTPDGTRVISAFLCLKGKRNTSLSLADHEESRLQHLKHWTQMDFVRRMTLDLGEVGVKEGVTDIEAAAREMVRLINQGGAPNGRTHARRPSQQYPGESERLDLTRIGVRQDVADENKDPTSAHINADFAATGSTYDPAPFWYGDIAFDTHDRGSHMGYVRAHLGRVVEDINGNEGYSIVIHSTIPGASGRNFCVWLDNSKGQSPYQPQFLIGHGGRFRNFWAQPDEILGENMHPAPMPLNKDGRPFAPVTTLREFVTQEEPNEPFTSNHDVAARRNKTANPNGRNISAHLGGISHNTVNDESFETQSPSTSLVKGLRTGKQAIGRINFGGLVASGVPGFSPIAGKHGMGRKGDDEFDKLYNEGLAIGDTSPTTINTYTGHVKPSEVYDDNIGDTPLYGFRFNDHRGQGYGVRFIYRKMGEKYANDLTTIPSTIDDEVCVFFNDADVAKGGFTIGQHMLGYGDATGRMDVSSLTKNKWRGNKWRGVSAPSIAVDCEVKWDASESTLTVELGTPYTSVAALLPDHPDVLGYLGFPRQSGLVQITDPLTTPTPSGSAGNVFSYESRTTNDVSGTHVFYGVRGDDFAVSHYLSDFSGTYTDGDGSQKLFDTNDRVIKALISPRINWTTLVTDELIAAVTAEAINMSNPNVPDGVPFDCRHMYASDGRTFGEWGVAADAIRIRAHNPQRDARPLSTMFEASLHRDLGIEAAHIDYGEYNVLDKDFNITATNSINKPISDADIEDNHRKIDCGYLPMTVLQIRTKARGYHTNTPTPVLVDSYNDPVPTKSWANNLKGMSFTSKSGDHILPALDNAMVVFDSHSHNSGASTFTIPIAQKGTHLIIPACTDSASYNSETKIQSFGELKLVWHGDKKYALMTTGNTSSANRLIAKDNEANDAFVDEFGGGSVNTDGLLMTNAEKEFSGIRLYGSVESEPITYFKGGRDSNDHSVPLYFGGGFSGVVLDVNDGSQNDYSSFYTHPYSTGPTGTAGIQNANEISTAYALVDCNALLAFFPGTPLLDQHRGSINPPAYNQDSLLSPDIDAGTLGTLDAFPDHVTNRYASGIVRQRPVPLVMRMPHQTARYTDHKTSTPYFTTYLIYGPGQAFPFNETSTGTLGAKEPHPGYVVTTGNTWSKVPSGEFLPNEITVTDDSSPVVHLYGPPVANYQSRRQRFHWNTTLNWSPAQGVPNVGADSGTTYGMGQRPEHGFHYGDHFGNRNITVNSNNEPDFAKAHPYQHCAIGYYGIAMSADLTFHMDGGYHPGGSWLDNQMAFNPPMEKGDFQLSKISGNLVHPTAFRVSGVMAEKVLAGALAEVATDFDREIIVVDGTRCQNGEELATIIGQAINENPGRGALKAMGGTFLPSMGNAQRQDRYGWVELDFDAYYNTSTSDLVGTNSTSPVFVEANIGSGDKQDELEQLPASGWIRTDDGRLSGGTFAPYHSREVYEYDTDEWRVRFWIAPNKISGQTALEDAQTWKDYTLGNTVTGPNVSSADKVYVWSKSGVHYYNNENASTRDHMTRVHFSGLVDALDRTRPVGAVGWAGERYSYLNSLKVGTEGYGAGLGAWHPMLGFSPYGKASSVMSTFSHLPHFNPLKHAPEASGPVNGYGTDQTILTDPYTWQYDDYRPTAPSNYVYQGSETSSYGVKPLHITDPNDVPRTLHHTQGLFSKAFLVISYEGELSLVAKHDRDGITATGDWLAVVNKTAGGTAAADAIKFAGTAQWDERMHGVDRFAAPAHGGPNIEALIMDLTLPSDDIPSAAFNFHTAIGSDDNSVYNAEPCFAKTGDLFFDLDKSPGSFFLEDASAVERNLITDYKTSTSTELDRYSEDDYWLGTTNGFKMNQRSPARNFSVEHVVWKRMDGGNLSLPAVNARGLGAVPFVTRVDSGTAYTTGEKLYGINRFSFETTNSAMFPIIQAQELAHPQIAASHPDELRNVLAIPNEEVQFEEMQVEDDTGQVHIIEGGSPFGTIVRTFNPISDRSAEGLAPATAGSGVEPNLKVRLPNPDSIPGNLLVRAGFDRLQAYQNETMGTGGMMRPLSSDSTKHLFTDETKGPRRGGTFSDHNWEHISQSNFPDPTYSGWETATGNAPLETSYELHDRTLFFHITKNGNTHSHRYPTYYTHANGITNNELTAVSFSSGTLTVNATVDQSLFTESIQDGRRFLRLYDPATDRGGVASCTGISGATFTGCVGDADFDELVKSSITSLKVVPSYYIPAGSTRFFAARRLRDHAEVSGNSPDMLHTLYGTNFVDTTTLCHTVYAQPKMSPLALPRMGHHFVNPTMAMLPGHLAHPAYQGVYDKHRATRSATVKAHEISLMEEQGLGDLKSDISTTLNDELYGYDTQHTLSSLTATPSGPSDIHGGAFTLMFESKIRSDGYGVLASEGQAGVVNAAGGHSIVLEAAASYTLRHHFPDPSEVGAYQIVIQPNIHKSQFIGFHQNASSGLPDGSAEELTSQQVALVVGLREADSDTGAVALVLAEATMADVRGCEVFINELIIDHDPDHGSQFTNIPPLMLYNALGVQGTESPAFVKRSLPYQPQMFARATPGMTTNIPWWSIVHKDGPDHADATGFRHLNHHRLDNYYEFLRASAGSIACQITLAGYPSLYPDLYHEVLENISLNPVCTVVSVTSTTITVDDARGFPQVPYYGNKLEYTDANGVRRTHTYTERSGYDATNMNQPKQFTIVANSDFTSNLTAGTKLRLTRDYDFRPAGAILTDSKTSMVTRILPQMLQGSRDTNSLHMADAFLCLWHPNLGRPHTYYSDSASRTWLNPTSDRAGDKKPLNSMPEHFETVHYHDAAYYASLGPFAFHRKTPRPPYEIEASPAASGVAATVTSVNTVTKIITTTPRNAELSADTKIIIDGIAYTVAGDDHPLGEITVNEDITAEVRIGSTVLIDGNGTMATADYLDTAYGIPNVIANRFDPQGGQWDSADDATKVNLNHYWPCGSRGGPLVSRLDGYGYVSASWSYPREYTFDGPVWVDDDDNGDYQVQNGVNKTSYDGISSPTRTRPFGYRIGLRQPYNKPQWALYGMRAFREASLLSVPYTGSIVGYPHGPLVQGETDTWTYAGGDGLSNGTYPNTQIGIMERQTNFSGMLGVDKAEWQVRYSDGMRVARPFGCPVRTLRNKSTVLRDWWGDAEGKDIANLDEAINYYLVDWWGNTRGEDVRRHPVRGFGIRPAWDAGDAYEYDRTNNKSPYRRLINSGDAVVNVKGLVNLVSEEVSVSSGTIPRFGGRLNNTNNDDATELVDVYMPTNAHRVGDDGHGRGLRYPTAFNEDVLTGLDEPYHATGVVLSHHTAEPNMNDGYIRARNDVLQPDEVPRGISARLDIAEDGLLKPEAVVSDRVETVSGDSPHKDAVSRSAPRIGLDTENIEGVDDNLIAINTEAHSLHTDRGVGQRVIVQGGHEGGSQTLGNYDLNAVDFSGQPQGGVMRLSHTSNFNPLGGTYLAETRNFVTPIDDSGWGGIDGSNKTANPYETSTFDASSDQTNFTDKRITFMLRPVRLLDKQHIEMFRPNNNLNAVSPQFGSNYFSATAGGKYGAYAYEITGGRASSGNYIRSTNPDANPPYAPLYVMDISSSDSTPVSTGPNILGTAKSTFDSSKLDNEVTRVIISENTLQHYRADASRRRTHQEGESKEERMDYTVQPRFSQSLHPKGHKGDVTYNSNDHSGDAS